VLRRFGGAVDVDEEGRSWRVEGGGLERTEYAVETDWSAAAFVFAAVAVAGGEVEISRLDLASRQGDRAVAEILEGGGLTCFEGTDGLHLAGCVSAPFSADLEDTPDLFPALSVVAAAAPPGSHLTGLAHLQHKESDRLTVMVDNLRRLGAEVAVDGSSFIVQRSLEPDTGATPSVTSANDHRVAMAMAVAALVVGDVLLDEGDCVEKSFPRFWTMWDELLGRGDRIRP
jgi:3-phosphoshikimate 1-carboxyvinyltransferase